MSIIPKIWNLCNFNRVIKSVSSNPTGNLNSGSITIQRFLSKRFTIGRGCKKPKSKKAHCEGKLSKKRRSKSRQDKRNQCPQCIVAEPAKKPSKTKVKDVCSPFRKKDKKSKTSTGRSKKPKCTPGMKSPCEDDECIPTCSLTKGKKEISSNECPKDVGSSPSKNCPKGSWVRGDK